MIDDRMEKGPKKQVKISSFFDFKPPKNDS
ncbi:hypothetical protein ACVW0P_003802 [Mucilaginibacter sp. UYNi724]